MTEPNPDRIRDLRRIQARFRRRAHLATAREYLYALREVREMGVADKAIDGGCGATNELHYRYLIQSSRDMARGLLELWP